MPNHIFPANATDWIVSPEYHGEFLEFGNAASSDTVGAVVVQFNPSVDFAGEFAVVGRVRIQPSGGTLAKMPLIPVAHIDVNVAGAATLRPLTTDVITGAGIIEIPANGLSVGLLVSCSAGTCTLAISRLAGTVNGFIPESV